ncbi:MAG: DEAD/DEAH box helicase family protein [Pseudobutyrivibrio sp.]|nr:DEAD/DEAH box helicase family protein [Pseudobutyrivibrio sp.]
MCRKAVSGNICSEAKHSDANDGVCCFYVNRDDIPAHKRVIQFFIDNNLIRKTKSGKLYNISFKFDDQTRAGEYGADFNGEIKLEQFIDLQTGEWLEHTKKEKDNINTRLIDNVNRTLSEDLKEELKSGNKISIAAATFSIYAFQELKKQLETCEMFRFIFTSPTFVKTNSVKEKREFYIPKQERERNLYGSEYEVRLRNEMNQKAIAKECADWIRKKAVFKTNVTHENMMGFMNIDDKSYMPINGFTTVDLGCERGNNAYYMVQKFEAPMSQAYLQLFEQLWNDKEKLQDVTYEVINSITTVYNENSPEYLYFVTLYNIFNEFLEDISEDVLPNEATGFKDSKIWGLLYNFQKDAAMAIINKLEKYNGCILADSVGLGKTFTALSVIKYYENRNKSVLVLCPKKLANNWNTYKDNYINNPIAADRMRYDVLFHTDLNREFGTSNGMDLDRLNWGNYDLVVIDESHNFRNGGRISAEDKENRYLKLMNKVIRKGVKTKVLMLSATPVNNRFVDLRNQLALAYEGESELLDEKLNTNKNIEDIFNQAQKAFNTWSKFEPEQRTTNVLLKMLDFDFFELLDSITIARSRKHIQKYYDTAEIGSFPKRKLPVSKRPGLTDLDVDVNYNVIFESLNCLMLCIYTPTNYILPSRAAKYMDMYDSKHINGGLTQKGREEGIRRLMAINLMKRLESSVYSFRLTVTRIKELISTTLQAIENYENGKARIEFKLTDISDIDFDEDDQNDDVFTIGKKVKIDIADMDYVTWKRELEDDREILISLLDMIAPITPAHDSKLQELFGVIGNKMDNPINPGNQKIIIFTAFADTAEYLYETVSEYCKRKYELDTALVTGSIDGRTTVKGLRTDLNTVLTCFSPISKGKDLLMPNQKAEIDVLIATDCISEGQNLQDCDYLINYDIHWNPVRIIQRFGRVDRIGSKNEYIQLVNFWPDITLDEYINLKARVETRMKIVDMTATGDDNVLSPEEKTDLEYRKQQLKRLQEEVVDIEDMSTGISIMDLGLNEFRLDLLEYIKKHPELEKAPHGMNAVAESAEDLPPGVIFVLRNVKNEVNINSQNRLHPFYMVYIAEDGEIIIDHLSPKDMLDSYRLLCRGKEEPIQSLCSLFNDETNDGKSMWKYSELLGDAISSIIEVKDESEMDSFLSGRNMSFISETINGLDDFELITFLVIK